MNLSLSWLKAAVLIMQGPFKGRHNAVLLFFRIFLRISSLLQRDPEQSAKIDTPKFSSIPSKNPRKSSFWSCISYMEDDFNILPLETSSIFFSKQPLVRIQFSTLLEHAGRRKESVFCNSEKNEGD